MKSQRPEISVVVPAFNEEELIGTTIPQFIEALDQQRRTYELIVVNDGSRDRTGEILDELVPRFEQLKVVHLARNFGQTAAMMAGVWHSRGPVIVPLDADGQNDPRDIEMLVDKLEEGYDVVSGWRKDRKDDWLRTFVSRVANGIISYVTDVKLHDYGCTLKAYRAKMIKDARLFGEMHRFIPVYASMHGARICEVVTRHHPRTAGTSKYGYGRIVRVALDMVLVRMLQRYRTKPLHFFGKITQWAWLGTALCFLFAFGVSMWTLASGEGAWAAWQAFWGKAPLVGAVFFVLGWIAIMAGLVAELVMRAGFEFNAGRYWEEIPHARAEVPTRYAAGVAREMDMEEVLAGSRVGAPQADELAGAGRK